MKKYYTFLSIFAATLAGVHAAHAATAVAGDYYVPGAHTWRITVGADHRFTWIQSSAAGTNEARGAWLLDDAVLYFVQKADDGHLLLFKKFRVSTGKKGEVVLGIFPDHPSFHLRSSFVTGKHREPTFEDVLADDVAVIELEITAIKRPNQAPEPTPTVVTPPAAQEARRP